jgi:hypothetical protein
MIEEPLRESLTLGEYIRLMRAHLMEEDFMAVFELLDEMEYGEWVILED